LPGTIIATQQLANIYLARARLKAHRSKIIAEREALRVLPLTAANEESAWSKQTEQFIRFQGAVP